MSKPKKKRSKRYQGSDAKHVRPQAIRIDAVKRSKHGQWWHENRRRLSISAGVVTVVSVLALLLFELLRIIFGW
jgi:hypothetical protein